MERRYLSNRFFSHVHSVPTGTSLLYHKAPSATHFNCLNRVSPRFAHFSVFYILSHVLPALQPRTIGHFKYQVSNFLWLAMVTSPYNNLTFRVLISPYYCLNCNISVLIEKQLLITLSICAGYIQRISLES